MKNWLKLVLVSLLFLTQACADDAAIDGSANADASGDAGDDGGILFDSGNFADGANGTDAAVVDSPVPPDIHGEVDGGKTDVNSPVLLAINILPANLTLPAGSSAKLSAIGKISDGTSQDLTTAVQWSSEDSGIVSVSGGVITAISGGQTTIRAKLGNFSGTAQVSVPKAKIVSVVITPSQAKTGIGGQIPLSAIATFDDKSQQNVTDSASWSVEPASVASIDSHGIAKGLSSGNAVVHANISGASATASLQVGGGSVVSLAISPVNPAVAIGANTNFSVQATYEDGSVATVSATWSSSATGILIFGDGSSSGTATALAAGTSIVTASAFGLTATTTVTVLPATLVSLTITPGAAICPAGGTVQFSVTGVYSDKTTVDLTSSVTWQAGIGAVASIANSPAQAGLATCLSAGDTPISAQLSGISAEAKLSVTAATLTGISINAGSGSVPKGATLEMTAKGTYSDGSSGDVTTQALWGALDGSIATVSNAQNQQGLVQGLNLGQTQITAAVGTILAQAQVTVTAATLVSLNVQPNATTLGAGSKQNFTVTGTYSDKSVVDLTAQAVWTTGDANVAVASNAAGAQGQVTAVNAGQTNVTATFGGLTGTAALTVSAPDLLSITVGPANPSKHAGQKTQFFAMANFSNGTAQNVTTQAKWTVSDAGVSQLGATGLVTAGTPGTSTITAQFQGMTGFTTLTVTQPELVEIQVTPALGSQPVGANLQFQAIAIFSDNTSQNITFQATWSSSDKSVATIANGGGGGGGPGGGGGGGFKGRATAVSPGVATITATYQGMTASATFTVTAASIVSISIFPGANSATVGQSRPYTAQAIYSDGTSKDITNQATWISSNEKIATVSNGGGGGPGGGGPGGGGPGGGKGIATALTPGTVTITANFNGMSGVASFVVSAATLTGVQLSPGTLSVAKGNPVKYTLAAIFSDGTSQDVTNQGTYTSSDEKVAVISNGFGVTSLTQTLAPGTTTITGTWNGQSAKATLTVTAATVTTIQVTPAQPSVGKGTYVKFNAVAIWSDNTSQEITNQATWQSSDTTIAWVDTSNGPGPLSKGLAQAVGAGTATITATWQGVSGSTVLTVSAATLTQIQVTPFAPTIPLGYTTQFQATGIFSDNSTQDLTPQATWQTSAPGVGTVSTALGSKGVFTPVLAGSVKVQASWQGMTGSSDVTVTAAKLTAIAITPADLQLGLFQTQQLTAVGTFDSGLKLDLTGYVTWLTDKPQIVSISNAFGTRGQAKALSAGTTGVSALRDGITGTGTATVK